MPIKVQDGLPAAATLQKENVFIMGEQRASSQDIRPLKIGIINLMPTKLDTETQLLRLLGNSSLQVDVELIRPVTMHDENISKEYLVKFYKTFDEVKEQTYDGMIITGAPVEDLPFEDVPYWDELCEIMEWTKTHVHSTFHICWGAMAGLYYHYGIHKYPLEKKLFGVFRHHVEKKDSLLCRGFDDVFYVPHSRTQVIKRGSLDNCPWVEIIASSKEAGVYLATGMEGRQVFVTGHSEYDKNTLEKEYLRDKNKGLDIAVPKNYYPHDDDTLKPEVRWRAHANLLYSNWLNYFVYQTTPYDLMAIK